MNRALLPLGLAAFTHGPGYKQSRASVSFQLLAIANESSPRRVHPHSEMVIGRQPFHVRPWPRDTSRRSSRKSIGWDWVQTEACFCARCACRPLPCSSMAKSRILVARIWTVTHWVCIQALFYPNLFTNPLPHLGHFSMNIAVSESHSHLGILREVRELSRRTSLDLDDLQIRLLETLRHRNIITLGSKHVNSPLSDPKHLLYSRVDYNGPLYKWT